MSPAPILLIILVLARLASQNQAQGGGGSSSSQRPKRSSWYVLVWLVVPWLLIGGVALWREAPLVGVPLAFGSALLLFPWPIARAVLIPLGLPRLASALAVIADWTFHVDHRGGAALAAALAILRRPREADLTWLDARISDLTPLRGAGVAASGLLALARGDREGARALLHSVDDIDPRACPRLARRLAGEWCAVDAAERGRWEVVELIGAAGERTRVTRFLGEVALRLRAGEAAPPRWPLYLRFVLAGRWGALRPLLDRALAAPADAALEEPAGPPSPAPPAPAQRSALARALHLHALAVSAPPAGAAAAIRAAASGWDGVGDGGGLLVQAQQRALVLGCTEPDAGARAVERLAGDAREDLVLAARAAELPLGELGDGPTSQAVAARLREDLLAELELAVEAISRRVGTHEELPAVDEWRAWLALRALADRVGRIGGEEARRVSFPHLHGELVELPVWLYNLRREKPIANAMFRWLLAEAEAVGDEPRAELERRNVSCDVD